MGGDSCVNARALDVQGLSAFLTSQSIAPMIVQAIAECHCDGSAFCEGSFMSDVFTPERMEKYGIVPVALARLRQLHATFTVDKEEADRKAKEEADRKAKEEADRKAKEEAVRQESEVVVDISWTVEMLEQKAYPKGKTCRLTNTTNLTTVKYPSVCCADAGGQYSALNYLLAPTAIVMDHSMATLHTLGDYFLRRLTSLVSIDLANLMNVTVVGHDFLRHCTALTNINLAPFSQVTSIESCFLESCSSLVSVNVNPLSNIVAIPDSFLALCTSLQVVDLSSLTQATSIGDYVLGSCTALRTVNLNRLSKVTSVRGSFLCGCSSLMSVDFTSLSNVLEIGDFFLGGGCTSLRAVDLTPISKAKLSNDSHFLRDCAPGLQVTIPRKLMLPDTEWRLLQYGCKLIIR